MGAVVSFFQRKTPTNQFEQHLPAKLYEFFSDKVNFNNNESIYEWDGSKGTITLMLNSERTELTDNLLIPARVELGIDFKEPVIVHISYWFLNQTFDGLEGSNAAAVEAILSDRYQGLPAKEYLDQQACERWTKNAMDQLIFKLEELLENLTLQHDSPLVLPL